MYNFIYKYSTYIAVNNYSINIWNYSINFVSLLRNIISSTTDVNLRTLYNSPYRGISKPIIIHINEIHISHIFAILPIINLIITSPIPIYSFIDGECRNYSVLYSIICYKRYIYKYGNIMIDFVKLLDKATKSKDTFENTNLLKKMIIKIFKTYKKLPKDIINNLFDKTYVFTSKNCIKYKLCDEII